MSLAPSWLAEFDNVSKEQLIAGVRRLGIKGVSETALGAEEVSCNVAQMLKDADSGLFISTACPAVVEYVKNMFLIFRLI